jgi:hypothetical protein
MVLLGSSVRAGFIDFNPTGNPSGPVYTIGGIDVAPGNALSVDTLPLKVGSTFQRYYQAAVSGLINTHGLTFSPPGLNSSYQLTAVASTTLVVTSLSSNGGVATFAVAPTQSPSSFFELYYNPAVVANDLAGTGFNVGTLILTLGHSVSPGVGLFTFATDPTTGKPIISQFDQFTHNDYPGISTMTGSGAALILSRVAFADPAFFKTPLSEVSFNTSLVTPFRQVDPSRLFVGSPGVGAPNVVPNIGTINGVNGPDFQFQADANLSFIATSIPEPAGIIQASLGLLGILCVAARVRG